MILGWLLLLTQTVPADAAGYFPAAFSVPAPRCQWRGKVDRAPTLSDLERRWYGSMLLAAKEPSLSAANVRPKAVIRFTWLRSFHPPIIVRAEGLGSAAPRLVATHLSGQGGYGPGNIDQHIERPLRADEAATLQAALTEAALFPPSKPEAPLPECAPFGSDGAEWVIEVVDSGGYHFTKRWSPTRGGVRSVGLAMLKLTGWRVDPIY